MRRVYVFVVLIALTGCAPSGDAPSATPTPGAAGQVHEGVLAGDSRLEGGCVWLDTGEKRVEVVWPAGYRASADPIELRDPTGAVVATDGDRLRVQGALASDRMSTCQVGEIWNAVDVQRVR